MKQSLLSVQEAQARILSTLRPVETEMVRLEECTGRILAEDVRAPGDMPPFDNSSMDGFAVLAEDVHSASHESPVELDIIADIPAGFVSDEQIHNGQAARIMTGAPLPHGANAVVPVEDTNFSPALSAAMPILSFESAPTRVVIYRGAKAGSSIRPRGMDIQQGQVLLQKGRQLQPQDIGILASIGAPEARVYRRPKVALFSSGDELVPPGQPVGPGQIYDSNQYVLAAMLERAGAQVIRLGTAPDDPQAIEALLSQGVTQRADLIVTSAGVSVGAFDFVRQVIESNGSLTFWKVDMRPGKPLAFGAFQGISLVGLPGNPVSAFVGCRVFVLPALDALSGRDPAGASQALASRVKAYLAEPIESDGRESYLRAVVREEGGRLVASLTGHQGSGNLYSLVQANALLIVPSGVKSLPSGSEVEIWFLDRN